MVMSPQAASGLDGVLPHVTRTKRKLSIGYITPAFSPSQGPKVGRNGYITPAFLGYPWCREINLVRSGCGGNEQKMDENG